ncbi:hypothetical protein BOX15_Mlig030220g1 [Macrostomum lignano]|uniref:Mab-21-like HhH/H2TH-like domain-containing protein n=1 Tax=Macrostomum lignano TaxID=282301 RepID=A0A267FP20_9PLAT|nr:hypothetical protein BOX15_Mlig030220g1 [Macrostomum lignano]
MDYSGDTALSNAVKNGHFHAVKVLVEAGAKIGHVNKDGLSCVQIADRNGHTEIKTYLMEKAAEFGMPLAEMPKDPSVLSSDEDVATEYMPLEPKELSEQLSEAMERAGFTSERARLQIGLALVLEEMAREMWLDQRHMCGSYAEGWANNIRQVNGTVGKGSDVDWTLLASDGQKFHFEGMCKCADPAGGYCRLEEGHVVVPDAGNQPAHSDRATGARPAADFCTAFPCCCFPEPADFLGRLPPNIRDELSKETEIHLVVATRPGHKNEYRASYSFLEKRFIRQFNDTQGRLFVLLKYLIKKVMAKKLGVAGLKSYHAKTLTFFMIGREDESIWSSENLFHLTEKSMDLLVELLDSIERPDVLMPHFFLKDGPLFIKGADSEGHRKQQIRRAAIEMRQNLQLHLQSYVRSVLKPLDSDNFYFHPFLLSEIGIETVKPDDIAKYHRLYDYIYVTLMEMVEQDLPLEQYLRDIARIPDHAYSARVCLTALALWKFGKHDSVTEVLKDSLEHRASRFVPFTVCSDAQEAKLLIWQHLQETDAAWRFVFAAKTLPVFTFLPDRLRRLFPAEMPDFKLFFYMNFNALLKCLSAVALPNLFSVSDWFSELQLDPDFEELYAFCEFCRDPKALRAAHRRMCQVVRKPIHPLEKAKLELVEKRCSELQAEQHE